MPESRSKKREVRHRSQRKKPEANQLAFERQTLFKQADVEDLVLCLIVEVI
jgi:hypothetical protein